MQASSAGDEVVLSLRDQADAIVLEVTDHGPGVPAEARARLFDAFFTTRSHGMGIGLAVVKRILDDHGFTIEVDSTEGKGTVFRVFVERAPEQTGAPELKPATSA